jgi:hypothetical protein
MAEIRKVDEVQGEKRKLATLQLAVTMTSASK